ncbi:unnamed protein product [Adineta steineri]|uniref:Uncharacterized protein n=1 Tax=Adineta steineri TaxID=433720 RepID=A0A818ZGF6_9BILA|nr:unnamed protein product [Adineta steineri]CAF3764607.1 unnamed protein product [Adineta steineri]
MALSSTEKQKRYRENLKKKGLYETAKAKHANAMKTFRENLTGAVRVKYLVTHAGSQKRYIRKKYLNSSSSPTVKTVAKATKKVKKSLPKDPAKKQLVIKAIAESAGLLPKQTYPHVTRTLSSTTKNAIIHYYEHDDISYQMAGKRDTVVVKEVGGGKKTYQKRVLLYSLREVHQMFLQDNPGLDVSRSMFAQLRPKYVVVKSMMAHRVCLCIYHQNVILLIESLSKFINGTACSNLQAFTAALVCDESNEQCMSSNCNYCSDNFKLHIENKIINENINLKWYQWSNDRGHAEKIEQEGTVKECVQLLSTKVVQYLNHAFIKRKQSNFFEQMKNNSDDTSIVVQVDYAENFSIEEQDAIQSAHWTTKTISIFTAHASCGSLKFSFALPSNNITHDKYCINTCLDYIINELKQYLPNLKTIMFFSDGASSQFKQRFLFRNLSILSINHNLNLSWSYFATSHGKGVVDAIGGTSKRVVYQEIMTKKQCKNAEVAIGASVQKLKQVFDNTKSVRDTRKIHHITVIRKDVIHCRLYSQSARFWTVNF